MNNKFITSTLLLLIFVVQTSYQVTIECEFHNGLDNKTHDPIYFCKVNNLTTLLDDRDVTEVSGSHENGFDNEDVKMIFIHQQNCHFIPRKLGRFFPELEALVIHKSNLQFLMTGDLDGLNELEIVDFSNNPVDHIGVNFFKGHSALTSILFNDCHIKKIDFGAFDDLKNLISIEFQENECIDMSKDFKNRELAEISIQQIYSRCQGRGSSLRTTDFKECDIDQVPFFFTDSESEFNAAYFLLPLAVLSSFLTCLLAFVLYKVYAQKNDKFVDLNEILDDKFENFEEN